MKTSAVLATILTFAATSAFAAEGTFDKTFTVSGDTAVSVATGSGYIHAFPGNDSQVHIVGHVHTRAGWFSGDADARVKQILANPPIVQTGSTVTVGNTHGDSLYKDITIDYDVTTPRLTTLKANTGSGDLEIGGIEGAVTASSGSGDIKAENIGANAKLETGSGSIHAKNVHGAATLGTGSGNLELELSGAGDAKAQTGSGSIHIAGLSGGLRASSGSGSLDVAGTPTADWKLESGSGSVRLTLGTAAKFTLNASTGSGSVHLEQPILMQGSLNKHHVSGTVNGGGPVIRATTGSGDIAIR